MHDPVMHRLRRKLRRRKHQLRDERNTHREASRLRRQVAFLEHLIAKHQARRHGLDHEAILDGCPMPLGQKLVLLDARRHGWKGVVTSADRRSTIRRLLHRLGKQDQAELYDGWIRHLPGYLPANPPTMGTHIRIGDGVVGVVGEPLPWWEEGIDSTNAGTLRVVLNRLGYAAWQPYKSASEFHHSNLRQNPHRRLIERGRI
jgi:hypothetical protein